MDDFKLTTGYSPGVIGRVSEMHALYYSKNWNFEQYFEAKVASELSEFICRYSYEKDCIFSLSINKNIEGSISIDGSSENSNIAHLRWFIMSEVLRGKGAGHYLMKQAMNFCAKAGYDSVYLWTFEGLGPARHLYEKYGFKLTEERTGAQWGSEVTEQRFDAKVNMPVNA